LPQFPPAAPHGNQKVQPAPDKIFDLGAFTVLPGNHQIVFSRHLMGGDDTKAKLLAHHGAGLIQPQGRECLPHAQFLERHRAEVLKGPARE
jgi:hypothetical protein